MFHLRKRLTPATRSKWQFFFWFLALFAFLDTVHSYVGRQGEGDPISLHLAIEWGAVFWLPYFFLVPAALLLVDRYRLSFEKQSTFAIHCVAGLIFTYTHVAVAALTGLPWRPGLPYWGRFFFVLYNTFAIDYLFYGSIVVAAYMLQHYSELKERELRASQLETTLAQTHLRAIQSQLNPHFFFNTTFDWLNLYAASKKAT